MNLFFDEDHDVTYVDFHCYFQRVHQYELPQEHIEQKIVKYDCKEHGKTVEPKQVSETDSPSIDSLRPDDRLQVQHKAGYMIVEITLSSWDEYHFWEELRGSEHDVMPPIPIDENNINPIIFDLLNEMWEFENYEVSKHDKNLFVKKVSKDYGVSNHHGIQDWLKAEHAKAFGESDDGVSSHFEFQDRVYQVTMVAID